MKIGRGFIAAMAVLGCARGTYAQSAGPATHTAVVSTRFPAEWYPTENGISAASPVIGIPYSGTLLTATSRQNEMSDLPGTVIKTYQMRDGAGRTRTEMSRPSPGKGGKVVMVKLIEVNDPVSHCYFDWAESADGWDEPTAHVTCMSKTVTYVSDGTEDVLIPKVRTEEHDIPGETIVREPLGAQQIEGLLAQGVRVTQTFVSEGS